MIRSPSPGLRAHPACKHERPRDTAAGQMMQDVTTPDSRGDRIRHV